jgi:23S rRNA (uracil1939-C5)-methyltransferase
MNILCPHFILCSGCSVDVNVANIPSFHEAQEFFRSLGRHDFKLHTGRACGWRCRARLAVRGTPEEPLIGLYQANSHKLVDIPNCHVHHPLINRAANLLRQWIKDYAITPYHEISGKGLLRYVQIAVDRKHNQVQLTLVLNQTQDTTFHLEKQKQAIEALWQIDTKLWHSIWLNFNTRRDNVIIGDQWQHLYGMEWLWDEFCGRHVCFHPASFAQANPEMFEKLLIELKKHVPQGTHGVEFYAGGGVIGLTLVDRCESLSCNEIVPLAEVCFEESTKRLSAEEKAKIKFVCGPAEKELKILDEKTELVIVDPPRKGMDQILLEYVCAKSTVKRLIYVSCGWKSFQKDCLRLLNKGWKLVFADAFLFFPGSDHIETLAIFDRREQ